MNEIKKENISKEIEIQNAKTDDNISYNLNKGLAYFKQKKYKNAIIYFMKSIQFRENNYSKSMLFLGKAYIKIKSYEQARKQFEKCIEICKERITHARVELGKLDVLEGKYKQAREEFEKCLEIDENNEYARLELGRLDVLEKKYKEAREEFEKSLEIDENNKHARLELGRLNVLEKKYKEAREEFQKCLEIDENNKHARLELGRLDVLEKKYKEAREEFEKCLRIDENNKYARLKLGKLNILEEKYKEAREEFEKCLEIDKNDKYARLELKKLDMLEKKRVKYLNIIRAKLRCETIRIEDLKILENQEKIIGEKTHYLIQIAIYEKLGQKRNALQVVQQIEDEGITIKGITEIRDRLKGKKIAFFDLDKWDKIIGWDVSKTEEYEEEMRNANNAEQINSRQTEENDSIKTEPSVSSEKVLKPKDRDKKRRYITSEDIVKESINSSTKNDEKRQTSRKQKLDNKEITILQTLSYALKQAIEEINCKYYAAMQPKTTTGVLPKEYYELLQDIGKTNLEEKKRRTRLMQDILKEVYGDEQTREKYVKKYDKLQSILECSSNNKRAKMELILVLINEGYSGVAQVEFGEEYEHIEKIIEQYKQTKMTAKQVKDSIDEYCL